MSSPIAKGMLMAMPMKAANFAPTLSTEITKAMTKRPFTENPVRNRRNAKASDVLTKAPVQDKDFPNMSLLESHYVSPYT